MKEEQKKEIEGPDYIGPHQVFALQSEGTTTPAGAEIVRVLFEAAPPKIMSITAYKMLATKTPIDFTTLRDKKFDMLLEAVLHVMMEYDMTALEAEVFLTQQLAPTLTNIFNKAAQMSLSNEVYGKASEYIKGTDFSHYITLLECDSVVKKLSKDEQPTTPKSPENTG